jgi:hypothetical protein
VQELAGYGDDPCASHGSAALASASCRIRAAGNGALPKSHISPGNLTRRLRIEAMFPL